MLTRIPTSRDMVFLCHNDNGTTDYIRNTEILIRLLARGYDAITCTYIITSISIIYAVRMGQAAQVDA